jgi:K(+)-stimulated pyrophosphate-energized sodium pump
VGDPLKDTSGPSMNILIKLMSIVSLVIAPTLAQLENPATAATHHNPVLIPKKVKTMTEVVHTKDGPKEVTFEVMDTIRL